MASATINEAAKTTEPKEKYSSRKSPKINFLDDERSSMTLGRRIALALMNKKWYNPNADCQDGVDFAGSAQSAKPAASAVEPNKPSLEKAWAYFEHVALNRYIINDDKPNDRKPAEPGESYEATRLYSPIKIPHSQLGDFGIGIGIYFSTLRLMLFMALLSGLISIVNIHYFLSSSYQPTSNHKSIFPLLIGSAICTETVWVPCPTCECASSDRVTANTLRREDMLPQERCQVLEVDGNPLTFVLKNDCGDVPIYVGMTNYATIITYFLITIVYLGYFLKHKEINFDEDEQTAQDYSVQVENPPKDATNPKEWHNYFKEKFGAHVTVCTCGIENDLLLKTLIERRSCLRHIELLLETGESNDELNIARMAASIERDRSFFGKLFALFSKGIPEYFARMVSLTAKVKGLAQLEYDCTNVFLTFETEAEQRDVLRKLSVGIMQAEKNIKTAVPDPKYLFRGEKVLFVSEPKEPNTIRWQDLNVTQVQRIKRIWITTAVTFAGLIVVVIAVRAAETVSSVAGAFTISAFNLSFPLLAKALTNFEPHPSESHVQTSLYFKISFFRCVNTAIILTIITPFTETLLGERGLIKKVYQQFYSEIVITTAAQLLDIMGHVKRHILAPRAKSQDAMNLMFKGKEWSLAERYSDMTKMLFLCVWYCSIFPAAYLMCALSLFLKFYVEKFCLLRSWQRAPQHGDEIAWLSHGIFFPLSLCATTVMSSYYWAGFPYDNLCSIGDLQDKSYSGTFELFGNDEEINDTFEYEYCRQNFFGKGGIYPFVKQIHQEDAEWMTDDQEFITTIFGWSSVGISSAVFLKFLFGWYKVYRALHSSYYEPVGADQKIPFSTLKKKSGYIPTVTTDVFSFPLVACVSEEVDPELFEWKDPDHAYKYYDLSEDATQLLKGSDFDYREVFSRIQCFPPHEKPKYVQNLAGGAKPILTEDGNWECSYLETPVDA